MTDQNPASLPNRSRPAASRAGRDKGLDGEIIPPTIRVIHSERETPPPPRRSTLLTRLNTALLAAGLLLAIGGAGFEAYRWKIQQVHEAAGPNPTLLALSRFGTELNDLKASVESARQDETVRALKKSVDLLKAEFETLRGNEAATIARVTAKVEGTAQASGPNAADILARLDKLDHDTRLGDITARLDRIEHQVSSSTPTGSVAPEGRLSAAQSIVSQTAVSANTVKAAKPVVLNNWIVRDVYSGIALVEGRSGGVREVVPGENLPGAGEVRSIERRGRAWIVVTSRGIIDTETW